MSKGNADSIPLDVPSVPTAGEMAKAITDVSRGWPGERSFVLEVSNAAMWSASLAACHQQLLDGRPYEVRLILGIDGARLQPA